MIRALAALALLAATPGAAQDAPDTHYIPPGTWRDAGNQQSMERWFGKHLASMREPELWSDAAIAGFSARYRLLVLPTFDRPYAVRIDAASDGIRARSVVTDGVGGYGSGKIVHERSFRVSAKLVAELRRRLELARFDARVVDPTPAGGAEFSEDASDEEILLLCADGTRLVLEVRTPAGYHLVTRHRCEMDAAIRDIIVTIARAGRIAMPPRDLELSRL